MQTKDDQELGQGFDSLGNKLSVEYIYESDFTETNFKLSYYRGELCTQVEEPDLDSEVEGDTKLVPVYYETNLIPVCAYHDMS